MDDPWCYQMHPQAWLDSLDFTSEPEVEKIVEPTVAPHTPWAFGEADRAIGGTIPHPELWGEYIDESDVKKATILQIETTVIDEEEKQGWVPPVALWQAYLSAQEGSTRQPETPIAQDREALLERSFVKIRERYPYPKKVAAREAVTSEVKQGATSSHSGAEWLSKEMHSTDAQLLYGAARTSEPESPKVVPLAGEVASKTKPLLRTPLDVYNRMNHVLLYEYPNNYSSCPLYGMVHRLVTYTTDPDKSVTLGQKVVLKSGDPLPEVLNGVVRIRHNESFTLIRSALFQAPILPMERPREFLVVKAWREGRLAIENARKGVRVHLSKSMDVLGKSSSSLSFPSVSSTPPSAAVADSPAASLAVSLSTPKKQLPDTRLRPCGTIDIVNMRGPGGQPMVHVIWDTKRKSKHKITELFVREQVYQILPVSNFYRVGLIEPIFQIPKRVPVEYWRRRIHHSCVILNETLYYPDGTIPATPKTTRGTKDPKTDQDLTKDAYKQGVIERLTQIYPEQKPSVFRQVWDDFVKKQYAISELLKKTDKLTPEECIAVELSERWKQRLKKMNIPQRSISVGIDKLKQLGEEIESYERERASIGQPFSMLTPRIKWQIEQLQDAPWHTSLNYQQVHEAKNSFFKIVSGPDMQFVKVSTQDPNILFEDLRTPAEIDAAMHKGNISKKQIASMSRAEKLSYLHSKEDPGNYSLRRKFITKERSKLSYQEILALYKVKMNEIYRRKLDLLKNPKETNTQVIPSPERELLNDFEADLLAESSSEPESSNQDDKEDYQEFRKLMGIEVKNAVPEKKQVKKIKQLRVVQLEKNTSGQFVAREIYIYGDEIPKYYEFCEAHPEGGYIRAPVPTDQLTEDQTIDKRRRSSNTPNPKGRPKAKCGPGHRRKNDTSPTRGTSSTLHFMSNKHQSHCRLSINSARHHNQGDGIPVNRARGVHTHGGHTPHYVSPRFVPMPSPRPLKSPGLPHDKLPIQACAGASTGASSRMRGSPTRRSASSGQVGWFRAANAANSDAARFPSRAGGQGNGATGEGARPSQEDASGASTDIPGARSMFQGLHSMGDRRPVGPPHLRPPGGPADFRRIPSGGLGFPMPTSASSSALSVGPLSPPTGVGSMPQSHLTPGAARGVPHASDAPMSLAPAARGRQTLTVLDSRAKQPPAKRQPHDSGRRSPAKRQRLTLS
eukprot:GEMP01003416.1.p1 GENE.GEMP01003416.1~~GEMP01003416.1.p1  ORF type:complete len:1193 (+),score=233.28 GEMP01003416.1:33-3581(+)